MIKYIRDWQDRRLKKRIERIFNNNVLDCNINVKGYVAAIGADETAWWRIDGTVNEKKQETKDIINHLNIGNMKKYFVAFFWLAVYLLGVIGGVGYAAYSGAWVIAVCAALLGVMAFPKVREALKVLSDK